MEGPSSFWPKSCLLIIAGRVLVTGSPCLELCRNQPGGRRAPFVKIDGRILSSATVESVIEALREALDED